MCQYAGSNGIVSAFTPAGGDLAENLWGSTTRFRLVSSNWLWPQPHWAVEEILCLHSSKSTESVAHCRFDSQWVLQETAPAFSSVNRSGNGVPTVKFTLCYPSRLQNEFFAIYIYSDLPRLSPGFHELSASSAMKIFDWNFLQESTMVEILT